jgi:hypothetical protein
MAPEISNCKNMYVKPTPLELIGYIYAGNLYGPILMFEFTPSIHEMHVHAT